MEGWRQRRLGSKEDHSTTKSNYKTDLTLTGLLMEGLGPHFYHVNTPCLPALFGMCAITLLPTGSTIVARMLVYDLMSNYDQAWKEYKWRRNQVWIAFFCMLPVVGTVGYLANKFQYTRIDLAEIAAIAMMALFGVTGLRFNLWKCPRCGKRFHMKSGFVSFETKRCCHCGLPKYSDRK